jgi:desulfoferrodoxin-like iron-binding protein
MNSGTSVQYHAALVRERRSAVFVPGSIHEGQVMVNVSKEGQVFKCEICGNVVVVKEAGGGELVCCGEPMILEA